MSRSAEELGKAMMESLDVLNAECATERKKKHTHIHKSKKFTSLL